MNTWVIINIHIYAICLHRGTKIGKLYTVKYMLVNTSYCTLNLNMPLQTMLLLPVLGGSCHVNQVLFSKLKNLPPFPLPRAVFIDS